jgi:Tol biopolymer transport system component
MAITQKQRVTYGIAGVVGAVLIVLGILWARGLVKKPESTPSPSPTVSAKVRSLSNERFGSRARVQASSNIDIGVKTTHNAAGTPTASPKAKDTARTAQLSTPAALASPGVDVNNPRNRISSPAPAAATPAPAPPLPSFAALAPAPQAQGREAVIVYAKGETGKRQIYLKSLERESDEQVITSVYDDYGVSMSSSTQKIAYYSNEEGPSDANRPRAKLKVFDMASGKTTTITGGLPGSWPAAWSPNGQKIAVPTSQSIFICDVTNGTCLQVPTGRNPGGIVWSPSNLRFYYQADATNNAGDIFEADAISAAARPITQTPAEEKAPSVSQDGSVLSFLRTQENAGPAVVTKGLTTNIEKTISQSTPSESYLWNLDLTKLIISKGTQNAKLTELVGDATRTIGDLPNPIVVGWDRDYQYVFVLADDDQAKSLFSVELKTGEAEKVKGGIAPAAALTSR